MIGDEERQGLVEVAHDVVTARRGRRDLGAWEEVEIELLDTMHGAKAERHIARALLAAGCVRAPSVPKLARALGDAARAAPDLAVPDLPRDPSVADAVRHALARSVEQVLVHDPAVRLGGDPEDLHHLRVGTRRLRSDLRTFREILDPDAVERIRGDLRWVADETNELRDLDVLGEWLRERSSSIPAEDRHALGELIRRFGDDAATRRVALVRLLGSRRYSQLVHDLVGLPATTPAMGGKAERHARKLLVRQVQRRWRRLEEAMGQLDDDPADADLHRARIAAKKCRATAEAVEPLTGPRMQRFARSLARLQDVLGAVHDASMMESLLRGSSGTPAAFTAGQLAVLTRLDGEAEQARWPQLWDKVRRRHDAI